MDQSLKKAIIEYVIIPFLRISPAEIDYLDYSKGFNHWDTLQL
jgi:hypothetical protein